MSPLRACFGALLQEFFDTIDASSHYIAAKSSNLGETGIHSILKSNLYSVFT